MFIVYKTTCLINNKVYIGVHETKDPNKFDGYIGNGINIFNDKWNIEHPKFPFHYAVKKYGIHNFKRETLFVFNNQAEAYAKEESIVNEEFIKDSNNYNVTIGGKKPTAKYCTTYQFDYNGNQIGVYKSAILAAKLNDLTYSSIQNAIYNKRGAGGFYWSYEAMINIADYSYKKHLTYYIYDCQGNFVKKFDTSREITEFLNTNTGNLSRSIKLSNKINGYFITTEYFDNLQFTITKLSGKINRYTLDGIYIDSFRTISEAKEKTGLKLCSISSAIKLGRQCNGYRWTRTDNPTPIININSR